MGLMMIRRLMLGLVMMMNGVTAWGLEPGEVGVLYNPKSEASEKIARHYVQARGIPEENLLAITTTLDESISEENYRMTLVPAVRKAIEERKLGEKLKYLVTTRGIPLKVGGEQVSAAEGKELAGYQKKAQELITLGEKALEDYEAIAVEDRGDHEGRGEARGRPSGTEPASRPATRPREKVSAARMLPVLMQAASKAALRTQRLEGEEQKQAFAALVAVHERVFGMRGMLNTFQVDAAVTGSEKAVAKQEEQLKLLKALEEEEAKLMPLIGRDAMARQKVLVIRGKTHGLIGQAAQAQVTVEILGRAESEACVDNELMLMWNGSEYPRTRWVNNPVCVENYNGERKGGLRVIGVSRLDGPDIEKVIAMIDRGIEVEKEGLEGIMYVDARGLTGTDSYSSFDKNLRLTAEYLQKNSEQKVVLDNVAALLTAEKAPNAALYAGWYSVHSYRDSCQWLAGGVGYHVASFEMTTLRDAKDKGWAPNLLTRGFAGTCGPVTEPYLNSFPKPSVFFPLLLSGEFTQGEVWLVTCPWVSWRMGYVGDPLYNPFKAKPKITAAKLKEDVRMRRAWEILRGK